MPYSNPNDKGALPESDAGMTGGTDGSMPGTSEAALERGYSAPGGPLENDQFNPFSKQDGGFAGRPSGWAR